MSDGVNSEYRVEWYLAGPDGKPWGPYTFQKLQSYVADGRLLANNWVCRRGSDRWIPAREIPGLFGERAIIVRAPTVLVPEQSRLVERRRTSDWEVRQTERLRSTVLMLVVGLIAWALTITPSALRYVRALRESEAARAAVDRELAPARTGYREVEKEYGELKLRVDAAAARGERLQYWDPDDPYGAPRDPIKEADKNRDRAKSLMSTAEGMASLQVAVALERERLAIDDIVSTGILGLGVGLVAAVISLFARILFLRL
jgi:hypothetical protein